MQPLSAEKIEFLVTPYVGPYLKANALQPPAECYKQLARYLDLLLRWNARTNLTAIRDPQRIVERHFGESLFVGLQLRSLLSSDATLLDLGSGAGFPGLPIQLLLPDLCVTLAESQGKKAAFLREAIRMLGLETEIWDRRAELMPEERRFDCVTLRAVDRMAQARQLALKKTNPGGWVAAVESSKNEASPWQGSQNIPLPGELAGELCLFHKPA